MWIASGDMKRLRCQCHRIVRVGLYNIVTMYRTLCVMHISGDIGLQIKFVVQRNDVIPKPWKIRLLNPGDILSVEILLNSDPQKG